MSLTPQFTHTDLLPIGADQTPYRLLSTEGVRTVEAAGRTFLEVAPEALRLLTDTAMHDIAHYLRPAHLRQLQRILDDPEASPNDRFVALDLLKNANVSAGGVLPMCQDTGTAIIVGKRGSQVLSAPGSPDGIFGARPVSDEEAISRGVFDAYTRLNLRYSQLAPLSMWEERNTGTNLPAQIEIYADTGPGHENEYSFLFLAKGGGSANKSFLYQETKAVLNPLRLTEFLDEKLRALGTAACPPYHLAIVVGGTSAEFALKAAKYASAKYLDTLPTAGSPAGHGFRDLDLEQEVLQLTRQFGIGAQFGGKYFCHDVRVIRLPRHGASCPVAIAVSCSADRQALGTITADGVLLEALETDPAQYLPEITPDHLPAGAAGGSRPGRPRPADERDPGAVVEAPGEDPAVAARAAGRRPGHRPREDQGAAGRRRSDARLPPRSRRLLRRAGQDTGRLRLGIVRAHDRRADGCLRRAVPGRRRVARHARQGQPVGRGHAVVPAPRRVLPRVDRRPRGPAGPGLHQAGRGDRVPGARDGGGLADRGRGLPGVHRGGRQGQRLLRRGDPPGGTHDRTPAGAVAGRSFRAAAARPPRRLPSPHRAGRPPRPPLRGVAPIPGLTVRSCALPA
jgi:tartrate dehydratase alpha subunit/fumarate hydratase class I-like protein